MNSLISFGMQSSHAVSCRVMKTLSDELIGQSFRVLPSLPFRVLPACLCSSCLQWSDLVNVVLLAAQATSSELCLLKASLVPDYWNFPGVSPY